MKIRPEKPTMNISILTGGKNEKARRRALHEKIRLDLYFGQINSEFLLFHYTYSKLFFNDYDVTTFENNSSDHIPNYTKQPIKVLRNKSNIM